MVTRVPTAGVLLISSELPELVALSTRVLVLRDGRLVADGPPATVLHASVAPELAP